MIIYKKKRSESEKKNMYNIQHFSLWLGSTFHISVFFFFRFVVVVTIIISRTCVSILCFTARNSWAFCSALSVRLSVCVCVRVCGAMRSISKAAIVLKQTFWIIISNHCDASRNETLENSHAIVRINNNNNKQTPGRSNKYIRIHGHLYEFIETMNV